MKNVLDTCETKLHLILVRFANSKVSFTDMNNSRKMLKESSGNLGNEMDDDLEFNSNYDDDDFGQVLSDNDADEDMIVMEEPIVQKPPVC